ncbi:MAG: nucleoside deaminase [Pacificimonas sp.]
MAAALAEARAAASRLEVPVGAVLVFDCQIVAADGNRTRELNDPTAHAEMRVIRAAAARLGQERLDGADLYVTLEPCAMCAGAIAHARIRRLYFGAEDAKGGGVTHGARVFSHPTCHHKPELYPGIAETEAAELLTTFFTARRGTRISTRAEAPARRNP